MKELILHDDRELGRIEAAIAVIERRSPKERAASHCLLTALKAERAELLRIGCRYRAAPRRRAGAAMRLAG